MVTAVSATRLNWTFGGKFGWPDWSEFIPDEEDCQDKCVAAVDDPGRYVTVLVGQCNNEEQRAASNEENLAR